MKVGIFLPYGEDTKGAYSSFLQRHHYNYWPEVAVDIWRECRENGLDAKVFKQDGLSHEAIVELMNVWADIVVEIGFQVASKEVNKHDMDGQFLHKTHMADPSMAGIQTFGDKHLASIVHEESIRALSEGNPLYVEGRNHPFTKPKDLGIKPKDSNGIRVPYCQTFPFYGSNPHDVRRFKKRRAEWTRGLVLACLRFRMQEKG
jgi:hypothetical protein